MHGGFLLLVLCPYLLSLHQLWITYDPLGLSLPLPGSPPSKNISSHAVYLSAAKIPAEATRLLKLGFSFSPCLPVSADFY